MPRIAIKDYNTSFFHVMVQGIRKEYIFDSKEDIEKYLNLLLKYLDKFEVKIIAYCVMNNHAHVLVYVEKIEELSEFMRGVNTTYALYYNKKYKKTGYVFKNRYRVEPIYSEKYLINCIQYIHNNPIKAKMCKKMEEYKHSSYFEYKIGTGEIIKRSKKKFQEINSLFEDHIYEQAKEDYGFMDYVEEKEFLNKEIVIENFTKNKDIKKENIILYKEYFRELVIQLNKRCGLTHQEIAKEFGISRMKITRIINVL